jgi:hypothetical protein
MIGGLTLQWWQLAAVVGGAAFIAALSTLLLLRRSAAAAPAVRAAPPSQATAPPDASARALTAGLIGAFDLADGAPAVRSHIVQTLRGAGVVPLSADEGARFDPAEHLAVGTDRADPQRAGLVARIVRPGWMQGEAVLRPAEVVVWTA